VIEGVTGTLFREQTVEALCEALLAFDPERYDSRAIRSHAEQFDTSVFRQRIQAFVERAWKEHREWNSFDTGESSADGGC
jgi:hypothetical protein